MVGLNASDLDLFVHHSFFNSFCLAKVPNMLEKSAPEERTRPNLELGGRGAAVASQKRFHASQKRPRALMGPLGPQKIPKTLHGGAPLPPWGRFLAFMGPPGAP